MNTLEKYVRTDMFDGTYKSDVSEAEEVHKMLNKYLFQGALQDAPIRRRKLKDIWAQCDGRFDPVDGEFYTAEISLGLFYPHKAVFVAALAHEMVHQWQWEVLSAERAEEGKDPIMSHGPSFYQWRNPLKKYMIPLAAKF
jgi:hypothetical protein